MKKMTFQTFMEQVKTARAALAEWEHQDAADYGRKLIAQFGNPDEFTPTMLRWFNIAQFEEVFVKDESILHEFPEQHQDFVYSMKSLPVPQHLVGAFAHVTGSIIVDGLKQQVTARCGALVKNAVTLGFVSDAVGGVAEVSQQEYAKRILTSQIPSWYLDEIGEVPPETS